LGLASWQTARTWQWRHYDPLKCQHHVTEDLNLHQHCCVNPVSHTVWHVLINWNTLRYSHTLSVQWQSKTMKHIRRLSSAGCQLGKCWLPYCSVAIIIIIIIISVMELGHSLISSSLTYPEVSSKAYHDSFCPLGSSVSLPWVNCWLGTVCNFDVLWEISGLSDYLYECNKWEG